MRLLSSLPFSAPLPDSIQAHRVLRKTKKVSPASYPSWDLIAVTTFENQCFQCFDNIFRYLTPNHKALAFLCGRAQGVLLCCY